MQSKLHKRDRNLALAPSWQAIIPGLHKVNMVIHFLKLLNSAVCNQMVIYLQEQKHVISGKIGILKSEFTLRWSFTMP